MKIGEAITMLDDLKANTYSYANKVSWLSRLDSTVTKTVLNHYEGTEDFVFDGYTELTDPETELMMPEPFAEAYIRFLSAQIDLHNADYEEYNNTIELFNDMFQQFKNWYNRNHQSVISKKYFH